MTTPRWLPADALPAVASVARLIEELHKLPGIGPKSAQRLAYQVIRMPKDEARALAEAILAVKEDVGLCSECQNITDREPCALCANPSRDHAAICVVEEALDVLALERTRVYKGLYHVLHGVISPMNAIGPEDLKLRELLGRLENGQVREVVLALNPNLTGEATALYIQRLIKPLGVRVTRLARGLPVGGELEYADDLTLIRAFEGRQEVP
ncbi:MAG: recombination protein RecR [Dehalococcoidia bacterium]|nr:recombination protein RecR [Dehalococcoidia bacterium]